MEILEEFLRKVVSNSHKCQHCELCHRVNDDECFCFFAYDCYLNDGSYYKEGD